MRLMRTDNVIVKAWLQNALLFFLVLIPVTLLVRQFSINSMVILITCGLTLFNFLLLGNDEVSIKKQHFLFIIIIYFIYLLIFVVKADNYDDGFLVIQKKLPILILPFVVFLNKETIRKHINLFYIAFILAVIGASIYCYILIIGDWRASKKPLLELFTYYKFTSSYFSEKLDMHPSYFSNFILLAILFINQLFEHAKKYKITIVLAFTWLYLSFILIQLSSRMHILIYGLLITYFIYSGFKKRTFLRNYFFYFKIFVGLATLIFLLNSNFVKDRFEQGIDMYFNQGKKYPEYYKASRIHNWKHFPDLFKSNPIFGAGTGNENNKLYQKFVEDSYTLGIEQRLNYHNQYFQELARSGIVGFAFFALMIYFMFAKAIKQKSFMYLSFLLFNVAFFLVESVLERHRGVVFFFFFTAFFYYCVENKSLQLKTPISSNNSK